MIEEMPEELAEELAEDFARRMDVHPHAFIGMDTYQTFDLTVRAMLAKLREPTPEMVEKVAQDIWDRREVFTLREEVALSITGYIAYWQATLDAISPPSLDSGRG